MAPKRLAEGKRIRTAFARFTQSLATGIQTDGTGAQFVFQDDVTVIGAEIGQRADVQDTQSNTDGEIDQLLVLTRQASVSQPGELLRMSLQVVWNGVVTIGGELAKDKVLMFPDGMGVEIDEGEALNLLFQWLYTGSGSVTSDAYMILYYVER